MPYRPEKLVRVDHMTQVGRLQVFGAWPMRALVSLGGEGGGGPTSGPPDTSRQPSPCHDLHRAAEGKGKAANPLAAFLQGLDLFSKQQQVPLINHHPMTSPPFLTPKKIYA